MSKAVVRVVVQGREATGAQVADWETRRLPKAARRIGVALPSAELAMQRPALAEAKLGLGHAKIRRRLGRLLGVSDLVSRTSAGLAGHRRATSACDIHSGVGSAAAFVAWFTDTSRPDYEHSMLVANPDHFLIITAPDGRQEVIETTGGSPLPSRFLVDYTDHASLTTTRDPAFAVEASGVARSVTGTTIGGVRHQFRDTDSGFQARLLVEFPVVLPPWMVREHAWHLAVEFTNWIELAFGAHR